jgi:hypothetical protein
MRPIFVFGSNLAGRHGKGAALEARTSYGAEYGVGKGRTGNAYGIPTKAGDLSTLPLSEIKKYVAEFLAYAKSNPELQFMLTPVGTGLAGYKHSDIAPLFRGVERLPNVQTPKEWLALLKDNPMPSPLEQLVTLIQRMYRTPGRMPLSEVGMAEAQLAELLTGPKSDLTRGYVGGPGVYAGRARGKTVHLDRNKIPTVQSLEAMLKANTPQEGLLGSPFDYRAMFPDDVARVENSVRDFAIYAHMRNQLSPKLLNALKGLPAGSILQCYRHPGSCHTEVLSRLARREGRK